MGVLCFLVLLEFLKSYLDKQYSLNIKVKIKCLAIFNKNS